MATKFTAKMLKTWHPYNESRCTVYVTPVFAENSNELIIKEKTKCIGISFHFKVLKAIPSNLSEFAPMMLSLDICDCGLKKITRDDLKGLAMLKDLHVREMDIEELPENLFADLLNLEVIDFRRNKIQLIGKGIFKDLEKLKFVDLRGNPRINFIYSNQKFDKKSEADAEVNTLQELNSHLDTLFPPAPWSDIQKILQLDDFKDFTIKIGEEEVKVHKLMLIARSPTFAEMIKNNPNADELILQGIEPEVFKIILNYIYNNIMPAGCNEMTEKIFVAAGKLKLDPLKKKLGYILSDSVTPENSMKFITLASTYGHEKLKKKAFDELKIFLADNSLPDSLMDNLEVLNEIYQTKKAYEEKIEAARKLLDRKLEMAKQKIAKDKAK